MKRDNPLLLPDLVPPREATPFKPLSLGRVLFRVRRAKIEDAGSLLGNEKRGEKGR